MALECYREIWLVDFEFIAKDGNRPEPICLVAHELRSGRRVRLGQDEFGSSPPYPTDAGSLFVAYYASAELGCHKVLGWPMPARVLDLFAEFRDRTNGLNPLHGNGLLGALAYFGLGGIGAAEKTEMRDLVLRGGPWSGEEREAILDYCESDVAALERLLPVMLPRLDMPHALLRGRYMAAAAIMEHHGTPLNTSRLMKFLSHRERVQERLIAEIDCEFHVYEGTTFKASAFHDYLTCSQIPWLYSEKGGLILDEDTFKFMAGHYPNLKPLADLRKVLADLRMVDLKVGEDGRGRTLLSVLASKTGRNQPSNSKSIWGASSWFRGFIQPPKGHGIAYIDWEQQEFAIAAWLSGDRAMQEVYLTSDPYIAFGQRAGLLPPDATKKTHETEREPLKQCVLGVQFGMGPHTLAHRINQPMPVARELLEAHHRAFPQFWKWSNAVVDAAIQNHGLETALGWHLHIPHNPELKFAKGNGREITPVRERTLRNFPMQANGAEMLRVACSLATERGIEVCAPVHDAVLICSPLDRFDEDIKRMQACMAEASRLVLGGFEVKTEVKAIRYPDCFISNEKQRGFDMWVRVLRILD